MQYFIRISYCFFLLFTINYQLRAQAVKQVQLSAFRLQSSAIIKAGGTELSDCAYQDQQQWYPVKVPSTVLTGLVANHVYPDPYQGMNNMLIPDASDQFNEEYNLEKYSHMPGKANPWSKPYWYRTTFHVPAADKGKTFHLLFKGINYRAEVWVNGVRIADSSQMAGMFAEYSLDVSDHIKAGQDNGLAVKIYPLDVPGYPAQEQLRALGPFYANGGNNGEIGKNVTMLCSVGWDWIPPVRDRNMGIWQPVYLRTTGGVIISQPQIITKLPSLPDTTVAKLSLNVKLSNLTHASGKGQLIVTIQPENFAGNDLQFKEEFFLKAGEVRQVGCNAENIAALSVKEPHLWWPNGYGRANLYRMHLQFKMNNEITDDTSIVFGIRTVNTTAKLVKGYTMREFFVNGKRVHLDGGAWVPDMMLNSDSARYDHELHLCRNANVNLVRIWGGGVTPPDPFWEAADRYGLMVWSDFWITGNTQGEFSGSPDWPLEGNVFIKNVISTIYRIRNHPSLLVWTGGNEGHARKELYDATRENVRLLDGTRPFMPSSSGLAGLPKGWDGTWPDNKLAGVYSSGPYDWRDPKDYYRLAAAGKDWLFKDETGLPSQPPYNSLALNLPDTVWDKTLPFPLNDSWGYHDAAGGAGKYDQYYAGMQKRYGEAKTRKEFSNKMQLMNYTGYQGIFEAVNHKLTETGGIMLWKLNAAFPSVIWQIYDWYLMPNAGYYAMQNACERVHIQYNQIDSAIMVINRPHLATGSLTGTIAVYDLNSKIIYQQEFKTALADEGTQQVGSLASVLDTVNRCVLIVLNLKDPTGKIISHNTYWTAPGNNYIPLTEMPATHVQARITNEKAEALQKSWTVQITNNSNQVAFFINPQLTQNGVEVLPGFWTGNYITLAPNESTTLTVSAPVSKLNSSQVAIVIEGYNVIKQTLTAGTLVPNLVKTPN